MPRFTYRGDAPVLFSQYLDVSDPDKPATLRAEPGRTYEIRQADGYEAIQPDGQFEPLELPMPPDGDWGESTDPTWAEAEAKEAEDAAKSEEQAAAKPEPKPKAKPQTSADKDSKENG